jgi:hypothetical protein
MVRRWRFRKFAMRRIRSGQFALLAAVVFLVGGSSAAHAQYTSSAPAPPGEAKPDGLTTLYEPCLTCNRPLRYGHTSCKPHRGCFQKPTLFEWSIGCDPKEKNGNGNGNGNGEGASNGNGNGNGAPEEPEEEDRLASDRPDFTEASSTVGRGRVQLESGYTYVRDNGGGVRTRVHSYPEALFRIGMFADWFELRIGQTFFSQSVNDGVTRITDSGAADLYLGVKLGLTQQKGVLPETALILQGTVPSGASAFTANRVLYGFNYLFGWDVTDFISFGGSFQLNKSVDDNGRSYALFAQSFTIGYTLTKNLNAYTEWFAFYPAGATATGGGAQHYFDGGFQYFVTNNFALDARAGFGASRSADDFFTGVGFVVRY